jgi:hypothetical protein
MSTQTEATSAVSWTEVTPSGPVTIQPSTADEATVKQIGDEEMGTKGKLLIPKNCLLVQGCLCLNPRTGAGFGYVASIAFGAYMCVVYNPTTMSPLNIAFTVLEVIGMFVCLGGLYGVVKNSANICYVATVYYWVQLFTLRVAECCIQVIRITSADVTGECQAQRDKEIAQANSGIFGPGQYTAIEAKYVDCVDLANRTATSQKGALIFGWIAVFALFVYFGLMMRTYTMLLFYRRDDEFGSRDNMIWKRAKPPKEVELQPMDAADSRPMPVVPSPYGDGFYESMMAAQAESNVPRRPTADSLPAYQPQPPAYPHE